MPPTLGKRAFVPLRLLDRATIKRAQSSLLFRETRMTRMDAILASMEPAEDDNPEVDPFNSSGIHEVIVNEYRKRRKGVSLPRAWAMANLTLPWISLASFPRINIRGNGPSPRDAQQAKFFGDLLAEARLSGPQDILANANTGAGKSVAGIWLGHQLQTRTLIIVDSNKIASGWLRNFEKFYGEAWTKKNVGRIQQDVCDWHDKAFVIGLVQSIARRDYPKDTYKAFGCVIFDEVQIYGTENYAKVLGMFAARVRVGFTAENRTGQFGRLIKAHLGEPRVVSRQQVLTARAYLIRNRLTSTFYAMSDGAILTGLSRVEDRNRKLAKLIKNRGYDRGRNVLILSDRTEQLVKLRQMCADLGIPKTAMGLHMGRYQSGRYEVCYSYGSNQQKLLVTDRKSEADAAVRMLRRGVSPVELPKALEARMLKDPKSVMFSVRRETYAPSQKELDNITNSCQLIFATYQIFSKGVDVPRLDMGVEALPSANLKQPLGRILRLYEGKPEPEWYAICDTVVLDGPFGTSGDPSASLINSFLTGKTNTRIKALKKANAKIVRS